MRWVDRTVGAARLALLIPLLALPLALGGCGDDGPSGPGSWEVVVEGPEVVKNVALSSAQTTGAVVEFTGTGITGATGSGATRVWWAPRPGGGGIRVVAVNLQTGEPIAFSLQVSDLSQPRPVATVLQGTDEDNRHVTAVSDYRVTLRR